MYAFTVNANALPSVRGRHDAQLLKVSLGLTDWDWFRQHRREYQTGRVCYELAGRQLLLVPVQPGEPPIRAFFEHHRSAMDRP